MTLLQFPVSRPLNCFPRRAARLLHGLAGLAAALLTAAEPPPFPDQAVSLFDGQSLAGWEGDTNIWRVEDGAITGGSHTSSLKRNNFLATERSFHNFDLRLRIKLTGVPGTGLINSGVQVRSVRVPGSTEMSGYQVDVGDGWWGKLYDESRRNRVIAEPADAAAVNAAVKRDDWNEYRIRAEGPRLRSWINGVPAIDYTEADPNIALDGHIGIQVHSGGKAMVQVKDIVIVELPPTPGAPTWDKVGRPGARGKKRAAAAPAFNPKNKTAAQLGIQTAARTAAEEHAGFKLPEGFEVELVAVEEPGLGKFVGLAFDAAGRLWTMTALEYPVDANENRAQSEALFARGGRDKVVVFDDVYSSRGPAKARVFADGLVMPLGILPWQDGAFVQYGPDIRFYRDTDGDGRADTHEVILTGFGTQDSHLFPHQFTRVPGGRIFMAQGLFNYSKVRRPDGRPFADGAAEVPFNQCKLGWFAPDGSVFEPLTAGPNNIWGLTLSREGEVWVQEANDLGYPVMPFEPGAYYKTGSRERLRPYQPLMPPTLAPPQMGGTGLSGLALADDDGARSPFKQFEGDRLRDGERLFYIANPITSRIQRVKATPDGPHDRYEKLADFLTSEDPWFRPVAIAFGPDGALYIVDWYNKIISHNEVPRNHPDRDKTRGRIWRIRHRDQPRLTPPNLRALPEAELLAHLGSPNARVADLAWQQIIDRKATGLAPALEKLSADAAAPAARRLGALWALEGLQTVPAALLVKLAKDPNANLRREAARIAAAQPRPETDRLAVLEPLVDDPHPRVRAAVGDGLRRIARPGPRLIALMASLGRAPLSEGNVWDRYDREFERYLARWAMEQNAAAVAAFLESPAGRALPAENRALATLALGGREAAIGFARLLPELGRPLHDEEVRALAAHFEEPEVARALAGALAAEATRPRTLESLLAIRTSIDASGLAGPLAEAARALLAGGDAAQRRLGVRVATEFQLAELEPDLVGVLTDGWPATANDPKAAIHLQPDALAALRGLAALRTARVDLLAQLAARGGRPEREAALAALTASRSEAAPAALLELWPRLDTAQRATAIEPLAASRHGAEALLDAVRSGAIEREEISLGALEKMRSLLPDDPRMQQLWDSYAGRIQRVLRLRGGNRDYVATPIDLAGPFTVEAWVKLAPDISNHDGILGAPGQLDMNFYAGRFRVWVRGPQRDIVVAKQQTTPGVWTHYAVTRDAQGYVRIYINGELDAVSAQPNQDTFTGLHVGRTTPEAGGTDGWLAEVRIWNVARSAEEIRDHFDRTFTAVETAELRPSARTNGGATDRAGSKTGLPPAGRPAGLVLVLGGSNWGRLSGRAAVEPTLEGPVLLTAAQARAQAEKFARFRELAGRGGDQAAGRQLFEVLCLTCHQQGGQGGQVAPALDGVGNTGLEAILRNVLTPNAAMESGYRKYRVETRDGELLEGLLVAEDTDAVVLRQANVPDQRIPRDNIRKAGFTSTSLMPEGLLEALNDQQAADLLAYLLQLK